MEALSYIIQIITLPYFWIPVAGTLGYLIWKNLRKTKSVAKQKATVLSVEVPKLNEKGPMSAEAMFASIHGILKSTAEMSKSGFQEYVSFEIESRLNSIRFFVWVPDTIKEFVEGQIYAQYPTAVIKEVEDYTFDYLKHRANYENFAGAELVLKRDSFFPIKTFQDFEVDPLAGITGVLSKLDEGDSFWMQILVRPVDESWEGPGAKYINALQSGGKPTTFKDAMLGLPGEFTGHFISNVLAPPAPQGSKKPPPQSPEKSLTEAEKMQVKMIGEKLAQLGYQVKIRIISFSKDPELARSRLNSEAGTFKQFNTTYLNGFGMSKIRKDEGFIREFIARSFHEKGYILNTTEIASLYHLPYASVETPNIVWSSSKKGEPPQDLPLESANEPEDISLFGQVDFRTMTSRFGIKRADRPRHVYIVGKSGMGKTELLKLFMISDIYHGKGVALIDPHGDLAEEILGYIPESRVDDVVYINPSDKDFPVAFNPLEFTDPDLKYHVASGFVSIFKKIFGFSWGPRLEHIFRYTTLALLEYPNSTTLGVVRMLTDKTFRKKVRKNITDPAVKNFWQNEFEAYSEKFANEAVAPILNKVGQFVATPVIRNIIGQPKSTIDFAEIINTNKILIVNLSIGKLGEDNTALLGAMLVTKLHLAAMQRAHIAPEDRKDFYLYVDEFQHFATDSFANILSEARKYKLCLTVANQYIAQMPEEVQNAVFGNVGTVISFRVGAADAQALEKEFQPVFLGDDLVYLGVQNIYVKMAIDGQTSAPFSATTLPTPPAPEKHDQKIIDASRKKYASDRERVEESISRWQGELDAEAQEDQERDLERKSRERDSYGPSSRGGYQGRNTRPRPYNPPKAPEAAPRSPDDFSDFESSKPKPAPTHDKPKPIGPKEMNPGETVKFDEEK